MVQDFNVSIYATATSAPSVAINVGAGTGRKAVACLLMEYKTTTVTGTAFDGEPADTLTTLDAVSPTLRSVWM